jgi:RNA polymerase sigma factor (sigma-70 family)
VSADHRLLFERLFAQHRSALRRFVQRLVGSRDAAEDIVQDTFERAYASPREVQFPRAFLFRVAHNLSLKWLRRRRVARTDLMGDLDGIGVYEDEGPIDEPLIVAEELRLLEEAAEQLPPQCRAAFSLRLFHAQPYSEIARTLGISIKTVEKHVSRGIRETHAYLERRCAPGKQGDLLRTLRSRRRAGPSGDANG